MPTIHLYANLRIVTGKKTVIVQAATIRSVLEGLVKEFPDLHRFLMQQEHLRPRVIITLNGRTLDAETSLDSPVSEQDQIAIFPPVSGG